MDEPICNEYIYIYSWGAARAFNQMIADYILIPARGVLHVYADKVS